MPLFPDIDSLEAYVDANITTNGNNEISGHEGNVSLNGCIEFIRQSPLNYAKASVINSSAAQIATTPVVVFTGSTPASLTWGDNIYFEYVFINMTAFPIPLLGSLVYYTPLGTTSDEIPANSVVNVFKASNDLWVQGNTLGSGSGNVQKQPMTFIVGVTAGAPTIGASTWTLPAFENSWVTLMINRISADLSDSGDGFSPYITKTLISDTLTINNYPTGWNSGDVLSYILITP